jgi:hypothetical protein
MYKLVVFINIAVPDDPDEPEVPLIPDEPEVPLKGIVSPVM